MDKETAKTIDRLIDLQFETAKKLDAQTERIDSLSAQFETLLKNVITAEGPQK